MKPTRAGALITAVILLLAAAGCSDDGSPVVEAPLTDGSATTATGGPSTTAPTNANDQYFASLCGVLDAARASDLETARLTFDHGPLHELAEVVTDIDRGVAADLLAAKEEVESALTDEATDPAEVAASVEVLTEATRSAYLAADQPVPAPCNEETP